MWINSFRLSYYTVTLCSLLETKLELPFPFSLAVDPRLYSAVRLRNSGQISYLQALGHIPEEHVGAFAMVMPPSRYSPPTNVGRRRSLSSSDQFYREKQQRPENQAEDRPQLTRSWSTSINQLHGLRDNNALDNMFMSQAWHTGRLLSCNFHRCLPLRLRQQVETLSWPPIPLDGLGRC